jgi:DNA-directed RNA polymerase subunit RPC12/RpoP
MAIYKCTDCREKHVVSRRWRHHLGFDVRCPQCGTSRVTKLRKRDRIDPMQTGLLNPFERLLDGKLYHCRFCRVQFYDRRGSTLPLEETVEESSTREEPANTA